MESAGARLKKIRLEKGLSLEEVHKKTKIHLNILRAIEEDSLIDFNPVYVKGFLKIYCKFLGVDSKDYIPAYKEPQSKVEYVLRFSQKPAPLFKTPSLKLSSLKAIRIKTKTIFTIILILVFVVVLFNLGKEVFLKRSFVSSRSGIASSKIDKTQITKTQDVSAVKIIRLDIRAKENCFIQVKSDGRVVFQNILRKGRAESWQAMNKIELSLGNAGVVELEVNGKRISALGRRGQALKNILITKEGLSIKR
jgi:transcriptional regulator with XRE-family HTH domain